jgi:hypothetical protein
VRTHIPSAKDDLTEPSPLEVDGGELIGRDPRKIERGILERHHPAMPVLSAIRAKCLDCCVWQESEVRKCTAIACALWPFRMGTNPHRAERVMTEEQRTAAAARLANARSRKLTPVIGVQDFAEEPSPRGAEESSRGKLTPVIGVQDFAEEPSQ